MRSKLLFLVECTLFLSCFSGLDASSWGYGTDDGPSTWGEDYETCGMGQRQSPIDLTSPEDGNYILGLKFSDDWFDDIEGELFDNGHTVEFEVAQPNGLTVTGGPFGDEEFQFLQLHFHWGSDNEQGSEHTINGHQFPMEMHMVHINSKYVGTDGTLDDDYSVNSDGVAVLGFMFDVKTGQKDYSALNNITEAISILSDADIGEEETIELNLGEFLNSVDGAGYFSYDGSFTTPGCNEVVSWVNFATPILISDKQIEAYRTLKDSDGNPLADNFRPVQNLNGRISSLNEE